MGDFDGIIKDLERYKGAGLDVVAKETQKLSLKHGKGVIVGKRRKGLATALGTHSDGIFLYRVEGDATAIQMMEFANTWSRFVKENFRLAREAFFIASGNVDEKTLHEITDSTLNNVLQTNVLRKKASEGIRVLRAGKQGDLGAEKSEEPITVGRVLDVGVNNLTCPTCGRIFQYAVPSEVVERRASYQGRHSCPHCRAKLTVHVQSDESGVSQWVVTGED